MDEFDRGGFDPEVTKFFKKIVSSFSFGMIWMLAMSTAGLYFRLALVDENVRWYNVVFYFIFLATLFLLIRYLYRTWKEG
ncbi:MAG TPA: hypothetical protein VEY06_06580 [Flavisolibacter sp.]|jgi:hypothetical protein|nr:hypothetical protein [Flavisolibacter sp.]